MRKIIKIIKKIATSIFILVFVISMTFSPFPFDIKRAEAAPVTIILNFNQTILMNSTTWKVPVDWTDANNTIEVIGGGGGGFSETTGLLGAGGGGGGAYSKSVNVDLTPGATVTVQIGVGGKIGAVNGGDTFLCNVLNSAGSCDAIADAAVVVGAKGGLGATSTTGVAGGASASGFAAGTGNAKWSGGTGGTGNTTGDTSGGGGGAGGPTSNGFNGGAGGVGAAAAGSGGGGGNGGGQAGGLGASGTAGLGGVGGTGNLNTGGGTQTSLADGGSGSTSGAGGGGGDSTMDGGHGAVGTNLGGGVGPGGGGGGASSTAVLGYGGNGGLYGGGGGGGLIGGRGGQGAIIITYNGNTPTRTVWTVPADWNDGNNTIEVIGGGGSSYSEQDSAGAAAGGGGGYAKSVNVNLPAGSPVTYQIGRGGDKTLIGSVVAGAAGTDSFLCNALDSAGSCDAITDSGVVVVGAKGGGAGTNATTGGRAGGAAGSAVFSGTGSVATSGGLGGSGNTTGDSGGGGGGAGQSAELGQAGGNSAATGAWGGGGGGGGGDNSGTDSTAGATATTATGGAGGNGRANTGDALGTGGGGDGGNNILSGVDGWTGNEWTSAGAGGGGGGSGDNTSAETRGGDGAFAGGGGGGGKQNGFGGDGIIVITYEPLVTFTQTAYRWYADNDTANPTDPWGTPDIAENTFITTSTADDPPSSAQELRLRVNMTVNTSNMDISSQQFKLQFKADTDGSCTTGSWTDVGAVGTSAWQFAASTVADGADITKVLTTSTVGKGEEYAKTNPTQINHVAATIGEVIEYDFHIIGSGTDFVANTQYGFRVIESAGTVFDAYTNCPNLTTEAPAGPTTDEIMRHGNWFSGGVEDGFFWAN